MRSIVSLSLLASPLLLVGARSAQDSYDLRPRFEADQELEIRLDGEATLTLDSVEVDIGGMTLPEAPALDFELLIEDTVVETILAVEGDAIRSLRRSRTAGRTDLSGEISIMGETENVDEGDDFTDLGRTLELRLDEDDELVVVEILDEDSDDTPLEDSFLETQQLETHFEDLLPIGRVEVGESWGLSDSLVETVKQNLVNNGGDDSEELRQVADYLADYCEFDASGRLDSVDDAGANIVWSGSFTIDEFDLMGLVREVGDESDLEGVPEDFEILCEISVDIEAVGLFDLDTHQVSQFEAVCSYEISFSADTVIEGTPLSGRADFSGALEVDGGVEVQ